MQSAALNSQVLLGDEYAPALIHAINCAQDTVFLFMYDWRWYPNDATCEVSRINHALVRAMRRGVVVLALINNPDVLGKMRAAGFNVRACDSSRIMHAKACIIDGHLCFIGSHNFTHNAHTLNIEASVVVDSEVAAGKLVDFFNGLWQSSHQ